MPFMDSIVLGVVVVGVIFVTGCLYIVYRASR